jgi:hypothetical protein
LGARCPDGSTRAQDGNIPSLFAGAGSAGDNAEVAHERQIVGSKARLPGVVIGLLVYLAAGSSIPAQGRSSPPQAAGADVRASKVSTPAPSANRASQSDRPAISSGTWTALTHQPPVAVTNCLLLTDATVMCQQSSSNAWYRLTPDNTGSYINGTWTQLASMASGYRPLYFASAVLADGRVIVEGGEYNCTAGCFEVWQTQGAIYDPATDSWTRVSPPPGWTSIGDASGVVLANGTFMLADCCTNKVALFNAGTLTWSATGNSLAQENDEAGLTLLPDGTVLTVDVFPHDTLRSERYDPGVGTWSAAGNTPVSLADNFSTSSFHSFEIGASLLRPDGTLFCIGANPNQTSPTGSGSAHTATFDTSTATWSAGPDIPNHDGANDAPAALLPNGNVLMLAAPVGAFDVFGSPSRFYEFDGSTIEQVASPASVCAPTCNFPSYRGGMLVLPTGEVLFTRQSSIVNIYTPTGVANAAWAPAITSAPASIFPGQTYPISGLRFNGLSSGAAYGDDLQAATNYPIVRIVNTATGHVFYAKTHDHSSMGVATGTTTVSTSFDLPISIEAGPCTIFVVANGIASVGVTTTIVDAPAVVTGVATSLSSPDATLNGTVIPNGAVSTAFFQYGLTTSYGSTTSMQNVGSGFIGIAIAGGALTGLSCNTTYHFRATATNARGTANGFDGTFTTLTTTGCAFTDDPLTPGVTLIKAAHIAELRLRIDLVRAALGLGAFAWIDQTLTPGVTAVRAQHIVDLRNALTEAYTTAGKAVPTYTDPNLQAGTPSKGVHITEIRAAVVAVE